MGKLENRLRETISDLQEKHNEIVELGEEKLRERDEYLAPLIGRLEEIDDEDIDVETIASYLDIFDRLFLIEIQKPYDSKLRSSVRVKQAEKRHLSDPSLAAALLKATPEMFLHDLKTLGF